MTDRASAEELRRLVGCPHGSWLSLTEGWTVDIMQVECPHGTVLFDRASADELPDPCAINTVECRHGEHRYWCRAALRSDSDSGLDMERLARAVVEPYESDPTMGRCRVCGDDGVAVGYIEEPDDIAKEY